MSSLFYIYVCNAAPVCSGLVDFTDYQFASNRADQVSKPAILLLQVIVCADDNNFKTLLSLLFQICKQH